MAFLNYYGKRMYGIRTYEIAGPILRCLKIIPMYGNPDAIVDIVDIKDAVGAMLGFVEFDCPSPHEESMSLNSENFSVGAVHYVSTAYVHGKRTGILMEEDVCGKPAQEYNNSYEESKVVAEGKVKLWFKTSLQKSNPKYTDEQALERKIEDSFGYYNLTNELAPNLRELVECICKTLGWSIKMNEKIVYCRDMKELEDAISRFGFNYVVYQTRSYWKRVEVLCSYLQRDTGTKFDCSQTKAVLPNFSTKELRQNFSSYLASSMWASNNPVPSSVSLS